VKELNQVAPEPYIELNPVDAGQMNITSGDRLKVSSRRGSIVVKALVSERPARGVVFMPFHYKEAAANVLTNTQLDPICKIPEFKVCAVAIKKAEK